MKEDAPPNIRILSSPREMCFLNLRFLRRQNWTEATELKPSLEWEAKKGNCSVGLENLPFFFVGKKEKE